MTLTHRQSLILAASPVVHDALAAWVEPTWWDYTEIRDRRKPMTRERVLIDRIGYHRWCTGMGLA